MVINRPSWWGESVRFGSYEILRTLFLSHRKSRHARTRRWNRIELRSVSKRIPEVKSIRSGELVIKPQPELVAALRKDLS